MIEQIFWCVFVLFIWFKTSAFTDYFYFLKVSKDWKVYREEVNPKIKFPDYLHIQKKSFFSKLISCEVCLLFWFVMLTSLFYGFEQFPVVYVSSIVIYKLIDKYI